MENRNYQQKDEEVIDLKELILYILRKWRVLILAGLIGVAIGCGFGLLKPEKTIDDLEMDELHLKEIDQYARYQQLYDEQLEKEAASVYMNMDPNAVHSGQKVYYISAYESDMNRIAEGYSAILRDSQIYDELAQISGLGCTEREIHELVSVWFSRYDKGEIDPLFGDLKRSGKVTISIKSPNMDACSRIMEYLDARVMGVNEYFDAKLNEFSYEIISNTCNVGYDSGVVTARSNSAQLLAGYVTEMANLKKNLTEDDLLYYSEVYAAEEEEEEGGLGWLKWGIVIGVLFGGMMVCFYGAKFLLDDRVKTIDELKNTYGLHLIACLNGEKKVSSCVIDRMLMTKPQYNSEAYLKAALAAMDVKSIHVCGDMDNAQLNAQMELLSGEEGVTVSDRLAVDENAQQMAKNADGVVLYVQLWNTKHAELVRELEIAHHVHARVLGVIVLD